MNKKEDLQSLLNGQCIEDCDQNSLLIDFILDEVVKPSGVEPVLENPEKAKTKGQTGQVDTVLKHFNNKVSKDPSQMTKQSKLKKGKKNPKWTRKVKKYNLSKK